MLIEMGMTIFIFQNKNCHSNQFYAKPNTTSRKTIIEISICLDKHILIFKRNDFGNDSTLNSWKNNVSFLKNFGRIAVPSKTQC